jgi:drug/metabolite transporter (DMT)-like permease
LTGSTASRYGRGALCGIAAVSIWAGWIVAARFGVKTRLTPWDIAFLRFAVAGVILMPVLVRKGLALDRLGWAGLVAIVVGGGAPMVLVANVGLLYAPAAHGGALFPGVMPLCVAVLASIVLREQFSAARRTGLVLILVGAVTLLGAASGAAFGALCPVMTAFLAIPVLGEWPAPRDWIGIGFISLGVYFVSGGPLIPSEPPGLPSRHAAPL